MCGQTPAPERGGSHTVVLGKRLKGTFTDSWTSPGQPLRLHPLNAGLVGYTRYGAEYPLPNLLDHWQRRVARRSKASGIGAACTMSTQSKAGTVAGKHASA
jgi:hypothetical protein